MSISLLPAPTWFVGCGNMAGSLVAGWRAADVDLGSAIAIRPSGRSDHGVRTVVSAAEAGPPPLLAILGFKPQLLADVAPDLAPRLSARTVVVSLLAGVEAATLRSRFPGAAAIVRAMPNLPVAVRRGVVGLFSEDASTPVRQELLNLFTPLGYTLWMQSEAELAALGSLAGAGPAYVARFIGALARAGVARGLDPELASTVALETVLGTSWLAAATSEEMDGLARRVASPKGTTEAGLSILDADQALDGLIAEALEAASRRAGELASQARAEADTRQLAGSPGLP